MKPKKIQINGRKEPRRVFFRPSYLPSSCSPPRVKTHPEIGRDKRRGGEKEEGKMKGRTEEGLFRYSSSFFRHSSLHNGLPLKIMFHSKICCTIKLRLAWHLRNHCSLLRRPELSPTAAVAVRVTSLPFSFPFLCFSKKLN